MLLKWCNLSGRSPWGRPGRVDPHLLKKGGFGGCPLHPQNRNEGTRKTARRTPKTGIRVQKKRTTDRQNRNEGTFAETTLNFKTALCGALRKGPPFNGLRSSREINIQNVIKLLRSAGICHNGWSRGLDLQPAWRPEI